MRRFLPFLCCLLSSLFFFTVNTFGLDLVSTGTRSPAEDCDLADVLLLEESLALESSERGLKNFIDYACKDESDPACPAIAEREYQGVQRARANQNKAQISCPSGMTACPLGGGSESSTCCSGGESCIRLVVTRLCITFVDFAWCSPNNVDSCPSNAPVFCAGPNSNTCCRQGATCSPNPSGGQGHPACIESPQSCQAPNQRCHDNALCCMNGTHCAGGGVIGEVCTVDNPGQCASGTTFCGGGGKYNTCCSAGTVCSPASGSDGKPSCYTPSTPTPVPSVVPSATPSPQPSPQPQRSPKAGVVGDSQSQ